MKELRLALLELNLPQWFHHAHLLGQGVLVIQLWVNQLQKATKCLLLDVHIHGDLNFFRGSLLCDDVLEDTDGRYGVGPKSCSSFRIPSIQLGSHKGTPVTYHHFVICGPGWKLINTESKPRVHVCHRERPIQPEFIHRNVGRGFRYLLMQCQGLDGHTDEVSGFRMRSRNHEGRECTAQALDGPKSDLKAGAFFLHPVRR
mmetsp:Transcript_53929/g.125856  ORF Transcript_53929/g.125856 Transcript_53929/m.125856 type:complete len:201 (+) Transcript_53929:285-887(+)